MLTNEGKDFPGGFLLAQVAGNILAYGQHEPVADFFKPWLRQAVFPESFQNSLDSRTVLFHKTCFLKNIRDLAVANGGVVVAP